MSFDAPVVLWLAPVLGGVMLLLAVWARAARIAHARRWSMELGARAARAGRLGALALAAATTIAVIAVAGPRWGTRVVTAETKGLNIVLAVDISRSMLAEDVEPSRLARAKRHARRLVQDLSGDRIGLLAFAGQSFVLAPLTIDASALHLMIDALDPDLTSAGGTELALALRQGRDLLFAGDPIADRVLVVFTDGEAHDSLPGVQEAAERLRRDGIRLIVVTEGGVEPATIPVRVADGRLVGPQRQPSGDVVRTSRRDDIASTVADAAHGVVVRAEVGDQAGVVEDLIAGYARSPQATSTAAQDISRAWIPALVAAVLLLLHALTRRTMALASLMLLIGMGGSLAAQGPRNRGDDAWVAGDFPQAAAHYLRQVQAGEGGDTAWFNLGTAAMALGDTVVALRSLERAAQSLDPELRFAALFNLGLLAMRRADGDDARAVEFLEVARRRYREALLLQPGDRAAKWNLELVLRRLPHTPPGASGPQGSGGGAEEPTQEPPAGLTHAQAEQILNSLSEEERRALLERTSRSNQGRETRGRRDW